MENNSNYNTYLFLSPKKFSISVYEKKNYKNLYFEEITDDNQNILPNLSLFDDFLKKNIFDIEKKLKDFIQRINLIIDSKEFLTIQLSIKKKINTDKISENELIHLLNEAKEQCRETIGDRKITHLIIDNYITDGKKNDYFPENSENEIFSIDLRFICLSNRYINNLEKILKNYQVSIDQILCLDYVNSFLNHKNENIFEMSIKLIDGYNKNEVKIIPKKSKNTGFFERFFNFFN
tara:strand:- start:420 stop:1124 length:705 start_codon:yes stop_codon:yes gene_type:complete